MPLTRSKPMRRTGFSRHEGQSLSSFGKGKPFSRKAGIRAKRKSNSAAETAYLGLVASLGCRVCMRLKLGETPAIVHHQRTGTGKMRASHYRTCALCPPHHQFSGFGVHDMGREQFAEMYGFTEVDLIEETRDILRAHIPEGA